MKLFFKIFYGVFLLFLIVGCKNRNQQEKSIKKTEVKKPNIIFLMDDQHRWDAFGMVNSVIKTPTLDSLAKKGVFFEENVCQVPMCIPSRNSIMFGMYANQTGVFRNKGGGVPDSLMPGKTMAQYLKDAGYETAGFGKTHWGKYRTNTRGFETRYTAEIPEKGGKTMAELAPKAKARYDAEVKPFGPGEENNKGYIGMTSKLPEKDHRDGWVTNEALKYIKNRKDDRPLFLYLSFLKPHAGNNIPKGYEDLYDLDSIKYAQQPPWDKDHSVHAKGVNRRDMYVNFWKDAPEKDWKLMTMRYYANVSWIDSMYGRALDALRKKGLLDNAIVIYTSDHGEMLGERYYRFNKYCFYESSVRVPTIISGTALPDSLKRGERSDRLTENVDILPTVLSVAGIKPDHPLPGVSLLKPATRTGSFSDLHEQKGKAAFMWRTKKYKLILVFDRKEDVHNYSEKGITGGEFYDLQKDPQEWNNLYGKSELKTVQKRFTKELLQHLQQMKYQYNRKLP